MHRLIAEATRAPFTLVVAPAGAGKSSLLAGWKAESKAPSCWLTVDETDGDAAQLWSAVIEALEEVAPGCGTEARELLRRPETLTAALDELIAVLDRKIESTTFFVLDDFHRVDDDDLVISSLAYFVQNLPHLLHVVLASRRVPKLPIDRMRARGVLGEVHFDELRFSSAEAREMLAHLVPTMAEDDLWVTASRVEGWAAGVQLAALAARSTLALEVPVPPQVAADALVYDYLWHEVLDHEDDELVRALSDIAVVERVNSGLAQALTGRGDIVDLLERAESRGLFVSHRGPEGWYELHALVRAALIHRLESRTPGRVADLHARAARWYEAADEVTLSLDHWLMAGEPRACLRLLADRMAALHEAGLETTIRGYLAAIPIEVTARDIEAMLEFAWCHYLVDRRRFVELVEQAAFSADRGEIEAVSRARLTILKSAAATVVGQFPEGGRLAAVALEEFGDAWGQDSLGQFAWDGIARAAALNESWDDAAEDLRRAEILLTRVPPRRVAFEGSRALGHALAGRPLDALRIVAGVRATITVENNVILSGELMAAEAIALREIGDRERARIQLEALADAPAETMLYCQILAILELAESHLDVHDFDSSQRLFAQAEALVQDESLGGVVPGWLARVGTRMGLAMGNVDAARSWSSLIGDPFWGAIGEARVEFAAGNRSSAASLLEEALPRCPRHEVVLALLRARSTPHHEDALKSASIAVETAASHGLLQTVVAEGQELIELVEQSAWVAPRPWMDRLRRAAVGAISPKAESVCEPLTDRERDVLRFLPSRLTLGEIANELYLSVNTLKFHLKVIYRKLDVNSRAEAAEAYRQMSTRNHHVA